MIMNPRMGRWVTRAFGALNILLATVGIYAMCEGAGSVLRTLHNSTELPYVREAYYVMTLVDFGSLLALVIGGIDLCQLRRRGLRISNIVFVTEVAWELGTSLLPLILGTINGRWAPVGISIAGAGGIGSVGTAPQILIGYPIWALIGLNLARKSLPDETPHN